MSLLFRLTARQDDDPAASSDGDDDSMPGAPSGSPAVAFIIGVSIVLLASILNAGGLNLTKLDHVRTSAIPKASRRKDWLRPLWLLGMTLYILSQLIGSTLALRYLRAEYVAPLGATSLIFNFLFASLLVGTPVTNTDIYGTIIVILGVVGIVAFGSINSGLENGMNLALLKRLWGRAHWLMLFIVMMTALSLVYIFAAQLERVLAARADISAVPFAAQSQRHSPGAPGTKASLWARIGVKWHGMMSWIAERIETWTAAKDDKTLAWTLGIAWACCGGGLAGGCLVFARTSVQLISYASSQPHGASQFAHASAIVNLIFLAMTAVFQIICLNRGLRAYDSTLVVPVFYGVYTGTGALDSLVFNDEVGRYHTWTLFLIFFFIMVLVSGVILLTHKKPEPVSEARGVGNAVLGAIPAARKVKGGADGDREVGTIHEGETLHADANNDPVVWELGNASDDDDEDATLHGHPRKSQDGKPAKSGLAGSTPGEEGRGLMRDSDGEHDTDDW